eukprot:4585144-Pyramimonas_sp.AAC.1
MVPSWHNKTSQRGPLSKVPPISVIILSSIPFEFRLRTVKDLITNALDALSPFTGQEKSTCAIGIVFTIPAPRKIDNSTFPPTLVYCPRPLPGDPL